LLIYLVVLCTGSPWVFTVIDRVKFQTRRIHIAARISM